jgi:hypothetical protein
MPGILATLSDQRRPGRPIKVAFSPSGHFEDTVTLATMGLALRESEARAALGIDTYDKGRRRAD